MGFFRQEYSSGLPVPSPGDLPNPGIEPRSPTGRFVTIWATIFKGVLHYYINSIKCLCGLANVLVIGRRGRRFRWWYSTEDDSYFCLRKLERCWYCLLRLETLERARIGVCVGWGVSGSQDGIFHPQQLWCWHIMCILPQSRCPSWLFKEPKYCPSQRHMSYE